MPPWYFKFSWRDLYFFFFCCLLLVLCTVHWWRPSCLWVLFFEMLPLVRRTFPFSLGFCFFSFFSYLKASWDNPFAFLLFIFFGMALFAASCTVLWTSIHSSSGALLTASNHLNPLNLHCIFIGDCISVTPGSPSGFPHFLEFKPEFFY